MKKLLTGNEAIAQGAWEAGVMYACAICAVGAFLSLAQI